MSYQTWSHFKKARWLLSKGVDRYWLIHLKWFHHRFQDTVSAHYPQGNTTTPTIDFVFKPWTIKFEDVRIVIVNSYPYKDPKHNHGLAISAPAQKGIPEGWLRFFAEFERDLGYSKPTHGSLYHWHDSKGVMMMNMCMTNSGNYDVQDHLNIKPGWEYLIYDTVQRLSRSKERLVFVLFGASAWQLKGAIDQDKHLVLCYDSPGNKRIVKILPFMNSRIFSKTLRYLKLPNDYLKLPSSKRTR